MAVKQIGKKNEEEIEKKFEAKSRTEAETKWKTRLEGTYRGECFDERLLLLRLIRCLPILLVIIFASTLLLGGQYWLRRVVFGGPAQYEAVSYFYIHYVREYETAGDYYINYYTWNTYLQSDEFGGDLYDAFFRTEYGMTMDRAVLSRELTGVLTADVESDIHVMNLTATSQSERFALAVAQAAESAMTGAFADYLDEVDSIELLTSASVSEVDPDVRLARAFILSAIVSTLFTIVIWLLRELGTDSIYLPKTLRERYGLVCIGAAGCMPEFAENLRYRFPGEDPILVARVGADALGGLAEVGSRLLDVGPDLFAGDAAERLRKAENVLLAVGAGSHRGKPLERVLEYFEAQDIRVTAACLAGGTDQWLIRSYYRLDRVRAGASPSGGNLSGEGMESEAE